MTPEETGQEGKENNTSAQKPLAEEKKVDIQKLLSIIPPASELRKKEARIREKRVRIRFDENLPPGSARMSKVLAGMIGVKDGDMIEIVIAGRKKFLFTAQVVEEGGENTVLVYPEELREKGVADNSIATVRRHTG